ncbi:MAG: histidine kinase [Williamsia sp.]|nr:histidine kinase [Williamsia sp.]
MQQKSFNSGEDKKKWATAALHVLIWLIVFLIPYIFSADIERGRHREEPGRQSFLYLNTALNCFWVVLFYVNVSILLPRLVYKRKTGLYVLTLLGFFCMMILADDLFFHLFISNRPFSLLNSAKHNFIPFVFTLAVSAAYKAIADKTAADIFIREKQSENLKTELSFLRSQISPHFLFNVMNNIVALVRLKSDELEPTVVKLSSLMQYMLYETDEERVLLKSEVEYLHNYIDLQKQRFGPELNMNTGFDIREDWHTIEPMLLIPFVENAFKHGTGLIEHPQIDINLKVADNHLHFEVKNKYKESKSIKDKTSGIGLANVKRRLELLYPSTHVLTIDRQDDWFMIYLHLTLK